MVSVAECFFSSNFHILLTVGLCWGHCIPLLLCNNRRFLLFMWVARMIHSLALLGLRLRTQSYQKVGVVKKRKMLNMMQSQAHRRLRKQQRHLLAILVEGEVQHLQQQLLVILFLVFCVSSCESVLFVLIGNNSAISYK